MDVDNDNSSASSNFDNIVAPAFPLRTQTSRMIQRWTAARRSVSSVATNLISAPSGETNLTAPAQTIIPVQSDSDMSNADDAQRVPGGSINSSTSTESIPSPVATYDGTLFGTTTGEQRNADDVIVTTGGSKGSYNLK